MEIIKKSSSSAVINFAICDCMCDNNNDTDTCGGQCINGF